MGGYIKERFLAENSVRPQGAAGMLRLPSFLDQTKSTVADVSVILTLNSLPT